VGALAQKLGHARSFLLPKLRHVRQFLLNQGFVTLANLVYGLLCVRLLPYGEYAKFTVVFGIQGTLTVLMDMGISGTLMPLIGSRVGDLQLIADFIASLRAIAHWVYLVVVLGTIAIFPWFVRNREWSTGTVAAMIAVLMVSTWCSRINGAYGAVLIIRSDRARWYRAQLVSSFGTLALLLLCWGLHRLNAFTAILINVAGILSISVTFFFRARHLLGVKGVASREKQKAIVQLALPVTPNSIFYALQGQISLMLITFFGKTAAVASVGALGRMVQVFALLNQMNLLMVEPHFARLPAVKLKTHYMAAIAIVGSVALSTVLLSAVFPEAFLWVLGPKYAGLRLELLLVIANGALGLISGVVYTINNSRRFVYWWQSAATIILTLLVQVSFLWKSDLHTVRSVLWFGIGSTLASCAVQVFSAFYGFARGPMRVVGLDHHAEVS
jgi:O-antigen/teichoic acid export membrane protein